MADWKVTRTVKVPGEGPILFADGVLWVVDAADRGFTNGVPNGDIYAIDPTTGGTLAKVAHARGGFPSSGEGAIWLINAEFGETVTRVDLKTHAVTRFRTSASEDPAPEAVAVTPGAIWVGNNHDGTVVKVDPKTLRVVATVHLVSPDVGGVRGQAATDGVSVWFGISSTGEIARIDAATAKEVSRLQLPAVPHPDAPAGWDGGVFAGSEGLALVGERLYASTFGHVYVIDVSRIGAEAIVADIPITGYFGPALKPGDGVLWALAPDPVVLWQIDPATDRLVARLPIDRPSGKNGSAASMAVVGGDVWVRVLGEVLELHVGAGKT